MLNREQSVPCFSRRELGSHPCSMKPLKPWGFTPEEWIPAGVAAAQATLGGGEQWAHCVLRHQHVSPFLVS